MNTQAKTNRIANLEQIIADKKSEMSNRAFDSWYIRSNEMHELIALQTDVKNAESKQKKQVRKSSSVWKNDQATNSQIRYLDSLSVKIETGMTKGRASQLIDAAKNDSLGSVGGFYTDGSN